MTFERYDKTKHLEILKRWYMDRSVLAAMEIDPMNDEELTKWLDEPTRVHLVFFQDENPAGCVNFYHYKTQFPNYELGYLVDKQFQGQGLATDMVQQALRYAKSELRIEKLTEVSVIESNMASRRVLEKCGFTLDGFDEERRRYYYTKVL